MMDTALSLYLNRFGTLNRNVRLGTAAPHKSILLLAVLAEIERGSVAENQIVLTAELVASFRAYWRVLVTDGTWQERIANPFRFMLQEKFWKLIKNGQEVNGPKIGNTPSIKLLNELVDYAQLAPDLWLLLQDKVALQTLREHLLQVCFGTREAQIADQVPADPLSYELEKLKAEAHGRFRPRKIREDQSDGYFVRHSLFPRCIRSLYDDACAVCRLSVTIPAKASIVDAVHIMPFGIFHNDDPRNGMTLCKNHHWVFDIGGISVDPDYKIRVSKHLTALPLFVPPNTRLLLPSDAAYAPAQEALSWHRDNIFLK